MIRAACNGTRKKNGSENEKRSRSSCKNKRAFLLIVPDPGAVIHEASAKIHGNQSEKLAPS